MGDPGELPTLPCSPQKGWMLGNWTQLAMTVQSRLKLSRGMGPREVESLWQLCSMEASECGGEPP